MKDCVDIQPAAIRHKWKDGECVRCGLKRKRKHWKLLMAITSHPPYDHYMHGCDMAYSKDNFQTWIFQAGTCVLPQCKNTTAGSSRSVKIE